MNTLTLLTVLKVYLDNCCYSRLFDIKAQARVKAEAERILEIINNRITGGYVIIGSSIVAAEITGIRNAAMRKAIEEHYKEIVFEEVDISAQGLVRAHKLHLMGLGVMDGRHLVAAEEAGADFLLTTDDDFIRKCNNRNLTTVKVLNPLNF